MIVEAIDSEYRTHKNEWGWPLIRTMGNLRLEICRAYLNVDRRHLGLVPWAAVSLSRSQSSMFPPHLPLGQ